MVFIAAVGNHNHYHDVIAIQGWRKELTQIIATNAVISRSARRNRTRELTCAAAALMFMCGRRTLVITSRERLSTPKLRAVDTKEIQRDVTGQHVGATEDGSVLF